MLRKKNDIFLKAAFEETFAFLLQFFFKDAEKIFDLQRGFTFMDKELRELFPELEKKGGSRQADMLVKVFLLDGTEKWILVHIEIQEKYQADFPKRMFKYFYRILDRFEVSVAAIAVFTGNKKPSISYYADEMLGTKLVYEYNSYHILDNTEAQLLAMDNPFALVVLAAQKALFANKIAEEELSASRLAIAKALIQSKKFNHSKIETFLYFLKSYLHIENPEININFDKQIDVLTNKKNAMGILETIKMFEREEGEKIGEEKGKTEFVTNLLTQTDFSVAKIASLTNATEAFVQKIKNGLK